MMWRAANSDSNSIFISTNGGVGIGMRWPTEKFQVQGTGTTYALAVSTSSTNSPVALGVKNAGTVWMGNLGDGAMTIASNVLTTVSDERVKDVQGKFTRGLSDLLSVQPILFRYNKKSGISSTKTYAGFSAQNVMKTIPEAVSIGKDGMYSFNDRPVTAALVNAVKELSSQMNVLKEEIEKMKEAGE
jgi:hypothetical protein